MGINITLNRDIEKELNKHTQKIIDDIKVKIEQQKPIVQKKVLNLVENKLNLLFELSIIKFYSSYTPLFYTPRRNSLYNLFHVKRGDSYLEYWFDSSQITSRDGYAGEDGLYTTVFKEGYHGGAKHDGEMLWRKPVPYYTSWGRSAERATISPYDMYITLKEDYEKHGFRTDFKNIWLDQLFSIGLNVR